MIIWLVDYDGRIENLALMRASTYHKQRGDKVILKRGDAYPELWDTPDLLYISCIFKWNGAAASRLAEGWGDIALLGGTGVDIARQLPPEIATCPPDYSLYGRDRAIGFISRGCIRNCPWCVVPRKEGKLHRVATAAEVVGDHKEALLLDNNFLALDGHEADLKWLIEHRPAIDFNQGLDARLVTPTNAPLLARCNWLAGPRLALDFPGEKEPVKQAIDLLVDNGLRASQMTVFVLIGFSTLESDIERLLLCHEWGVNAYPMGFRDLDTGEEPARGWDRKLYKKFRRLIIRLPQANSVWSDFREELHV